MAKFGTLTHKQARFCEEYLIDTNGTQAAIRAGYSSRSASEISSELLGKLPIQSNIQCLRDSLSERNAISADRVVTELSLIAFAALDHELVDLKSKLKALELVGKQLGMFRDRVDVESRVTLEDLIVASNQL